VLFLAVDDLRPELGCYGVEGVHSPQIDRLAGSGVVFQRAYCQVAVCNPSRVSLLTGLRPDTTRVWDLVTRFRETIPDAVTLPQQFRKHGYHAVSYGKIFHNPWPDNDSWDEPHRWPEQARLWSDEAKQRLAEFRRQMREEGKSAAAVRRMRAPAVEIVDYPEEEHIDVAIAEQGLKAMRRLAKRDEPFFLAVGLIRPHLPFVVPRDYWELYEREAIPLAQDRFLPRGAPRFAINTMYELRDYLDYAAAPDPRAGSLDESRQRELKHGYLASVSLIDAQVGRLLDQLDALDLADETIVILWGDHGWKLGEHNSWCKQTNYEVDTRVPLILRVPGAKANGRSTRALVELVDVYPTLCEAAGLPIPDELEGASLAPLLHDAKAAVKKAAFSQFRRRHRDGERMGYAMRTDRYRYVEWIDRNDGSIADRELYDHEGDPRESVNLADEADQAERVQKLSAQLWRTLPPPPRPKAGAAKKPEAGNQRGGTQEDDRPNIVVIVGDDWSWPHAGCLGDPVVNTPTFDRIAREGVLFEHAFASAPSCTPSRFAAATGQFHWRLGEGMNLGGSLAADVPVYPDLLAEAGYATGHAR